VIGGGDKPPSPLVIVSDVDSEFVVGDLLLAKVDCGVSLPAASDWVDCDDYSEICVFRTPV